MYTNGNLDYERQTSYHLTIRACSQGIGRGAPTYVASTFAVGMSAAAATLGNSGFVNQDCTFKDFTIAVQDQNDAPTAVEYLDKSTEDVVSPHPAFSDMIPLVTVPENSVADTVVAKIRTIDPDKTTQTFTYEIIGAAGGSRFPFKLSTTSSTGTGIINLVVNDSSLFDFESNGVTASAATGNMPSRGILFVRIRSTDATLSAPVKTLAVRITNVIEAPTLVVESLNMKLTELSAPGTVVGSVKASADDFGVHPLRYAVTSNGGTASTFLGIHSCSGNVYVLDDFAPAFVLPTNSAEKVYYELNIDVTGESKVQTKVRVELIMRSRAPVWANGGEVVVQVDESSAVDSVVVGSLLDTTGGSSTPNGVVDPNGDSPLFFSIVSGNKGGIFRLSNAATGKVVVERTGLNFESVRVYQLRVMVTDATSTTNTGSGMVSYGTIVVNVQDINDAPFVEAGLSFEIAENSVGSTTVGYPIFYHDEEIAAGSSQVVTFTTSSDNIGPSFAFKSDVAGQLIVAGVAGQINQNLNFEVKGVYALGVVATDGKSLLLLFFRV